MTDTLERREAMQSALAVLNAIRAGQSPQSYDLTGCIERMEAALTTSPRVDEGHLPRTCDGVEQDAFEAWAEANHFDMHQHPLHWLFLNPETSAARKGWRAGLEHSVERVKAALATTPADPRVGKMVELLQRCEAELRLIRAKDTNAVYDIGLRSDLHATLSQIEGRG